MKKSDQYKFRVSCKRMMYDKESGVLLPVEEHYYFLRFDKARRKYKQLLKKNNGYMWIKRIIGFKVALNRGSSAEWDAPLYQEKENEEGFSSLPFAS